MGLLAKANLPLKYIENKSEHYDVIIVGGGPAGSTCAYYLAKAGKRVLLLEKKVCCDFFPPLFIVFHLSYHSSSYIHKIRFAEIVRYCSTEKKKLLFSTSSCLFPLIPRIGITPLAQQHLLEMGVLQEILAEHKGRWLQRGGFVSPSGHSFVSDFTSDRELCVQRVILDAHMARAAERAGAQIMQQHLVFNVQREGALWQVTAMTGNGERKQEEVMFIGRMLVVADGAQGPVSSVLSPSRANAVAVRSFVQPGTHEFRADRVVFYPRSLLPGFCVVSRELEGFLSVTSYAMPNCSEEAIRMLASHRTLLETDKHLLEALGSKFQLTTTQSAPLRVGGVGTSYGDQFLLIGDAAGFADPLTGQGIQFGMEGARIAARTIVEAFASGDLSKSSLRAYQDRWRLKFGWSFVLSRVFARLVARYPMILDGACSTIRSNGESWTTAWNSALSGHRSKLWFLRPDVGVIIVLETLRLWILQFLHRHAAPPLLRQLFVPKSKLRTFVSESQEAQ